MLSTKNRSNERTRHSYSQPELLPHERSARSIRGFSLEPSMVLDNDAIHHLRNNQLMEAITRIEKENETLRRENLLYSRYLRRVNRSKLVETFDDYESDATPNEEGVNSNQTSVRISLPEIIRRSSVKKNLNSSSKGIPLWRKLSASWHESMYAPLLLRVEQEKLSIAAYEIEQSTLDWKRMKTNASLTFDHLDVLLRTTESDEIAEAMLKDDLEKNTHKFRINIGDKELNNPRFMAPAELVISRINERIHSQINSTGLLHITNARIQLRIRTINATITALDDLREKTDEIDINFVRTRKIDYSDTYEKLDRKYKIEKSSQYPTLRRLEQWKKMLSEREKEKIDCEEKSALLEYRLDKINNEIDYVQHENELILKENNFLRNQTVDVNKVPTIMDYAYIIEQTKKLQHAIDIWTKRVTIAEYFER